MCVVGVSVKMCVSARAHILTHARQHSSETLREAIFSRTKPKPIVRNVSVRLASELADFAHDSLLTSEKVGAR